MAVTERAQSPFAGFDSEAWVDNHTYTDPRVYDLELERIFDRVWLMVAHESEIPNPGDYITIDVAHNPMIIVRDERGQVRAFHNVCRHRGSKVACEASGTARSFRCPYHNWNYSLDGQLVTVPGEEAYANTAFDKASFPLVEASCESVLGLVFVHQSEKPPQSAAEWLGPELVEALSKPLANPDLEVFDAKHVQIDINWKVFAENTRDGYHVPFVHPFYRSTSPPGNYRLLRNSHAIQELRSDVSRLDDELAAQMMTAPLPGVAPGDGYVVNIFPDAIITLRTNVVSIDFQVLNGPDSVIMQNRTLGIRGDGDDTRKARAASQAAWVQDRLEYEDFPVFHSQQAGLRSRKVRHSLIARGAPATEGTRGDDNRLRHFWVLWRELMGAPNNSAAALID